MGETDNTPLPAKDRKKKRSFFEDDDFFVMRKNKKPKSPAPAKLQSGNLPKKRSPSKSSHSIPSSAGSPDSLDSDDLLQSFHSAKDAFSGDDAEIPLLTDTVAVASEPVIEVEEILDVDGDDPDTELSKFFNGISTASAQQSLPSEEASRVYKVKIISKVYHFEDASEVPGDVTFETMLQRALATHGHFYRDDNVLMWVEGKSELKGFFKPSTLRIPPSPYGTPTQVTVLHVFKEQLPEIESLYQQYEGKSLPDENSWQIQDALVVLVEEVTDDSPPSPRDSTSDYFVIGLKGKDNKRIECEVGPETRISDLLAYYLKVKEVDEKSVKKPKLIFDDEVLDLNGKVGDTELEADFEVQVYV